MSGFWTDKRLAILIAAWIAGDSAGVAAQKLGCPRNAAIGKLNRLGFIGSSGLPTRTLRSQAVRLTWRDPDVRARRIVAIRDGMRQRQQAIGM